MGFAGTYRNPPDPLVEVVIGGRRAAKLAADTDLALASLKGAAYYNTYGSVFASNMGIGGVVMRYFPVPVKPPEVFGARTGDRTAAIR